MLFNSYTIIKQHILYIHTLHVEYFLHLVQRKLVQNAAAIQPWTTPEGMLETSEGLSPPPTVPVPRPMKISLRTESLAADKFAGGFPS